MKIGNLFVIASILLGCHKYTKNTIQSIYCSDYECVVPDSIFNVYKNVKNFYFGASAVTICDNAYSWPNKRERKQLEDEFKKAGLPEIVEIFTTNGNIIYSESVTKNPKFNSIRKHELVHHIMCNMDKKKLKILEDAHSKIMKVYFGDEPLVKDYYRGVAKAQSVDYNEFYAHLLGGTLNKDEIITYMKENLPQACRIVEEIENQIESVLKNEK
jgi:hypothetical protein